MKVGLSAASIFTIWFSFLVAPSIAKDKNNEDSNLLSTDFLDACTHGKVDFIQEALGKNPNLVGGRSENGETCLHVAGIMGQSEVTRLILQNGGDANIRSTYSGGLRMHPLSWNVYGGHVETAQVLIEEGKANVNLDYDTGDSTKSGPVTVLDTILDILSVDEGNDDKPDPQLERYYQMKELLLKHGAKRYRDLK